MFNAGARDGIKFTPIHAAAWTLSVLTPFFMRVLGYVLDYAVIDLDLFHPLILLLFVAAKRP